MRQKKRKNIIFRRRNKQGYIVRLIQYDDIASLLRLEREIYHGVLQWSKLTFERELSNSAPHLYLLVEHHQEVIAFIGVRIQDKKAHITNLAVGAKYRHQGIATSLMQRAERFAKKHRCHALTLEVRMTNFEAKRFYRHRHYKARRVLHHYYVDNQEDGVLMEKAL